MSSSLQIAPDYIQRYLNGESMQTIASELGVHRATLYRHMLADTRADHHDIVTHMLVQRISDANQRLENADNACDIARACEMARFARMDYERRRPALYGQRQQLDVTHHSYSDTLRSIDAIADAEIVSESQQVSPGTLADEEDGAS